jgi:hypothetical protein
MYLLQNGYLWSYLSMQSHLHRIHLTPIRPASSGVKGHARPDPLSRMFPNTKSSSPPRLTHPNRRYLPLLLSRPLTAGLAQLIRTLHLNALRGGSPKDDRFIDTPPDPIPRHPKNAAEVQSDVPVQRSHRHCGWSEAWGCYIYT